VAEPAVDRAAFTRRFDTLAEIGRHGAGWTRLAWTAEDALARAWFTAEAERCGLDVRRDRNADLWAWWGDPGSDAVVTGSHLDTVVQGGAFDGALGVVAGLAAVEVLQRAGAAPTRPVAVVAFTDEEGGRFNTPCLGSRLLTGAADPAALRDRPDADGVTLARAAADAGVDPDAFGADPEALARIGVFVELHVEQGRGLVDLDKPLAVADAIWPHGRWRLEVAGETNHAGTTMLTDRRDALLVAATAVEAARRQAELGTGVATVGRMEIAPNAANAVPGLARVWLDAREREEAALERLVEGWRVAVAEAAATHGCSATVTEESRTAAALFDPELTRRVAELLDPEGDVPVLSTGAGHDAGILSAHAPAAMLFVRNPTGASHTPAEHATVDDCLVGVAGLAAVLRELACR
jgi:N-carbamoyl-L-amino-acid hydrolase